MTKVNKLSLAMCLVVIAQTALSFAISSERPKKSLENLSLVAQDTSGLYQARSGEVEVVERRTENSKTFAKKLPNGKTQYRVVAEMGPIHYKDNPADSEEVWKEINLNIEKQNAIEKVDKVPYYGVRLSDYVGYQIIHKSSGDYIKEVLLNSSGVPIYHNGKIDGNKKVYQGVFPNTDFEVVVTPRGAKGNLIIKSPQAPHEFRFKLLSDQRGRTINGRRIKFGHLNTFIFVWDKSGREIPYNFNFDNGILTISIIPTSNVVYPITIDPASIPEEQVDASSDDAQNSGTTYPGDGNYAENATTMRLGFYGTGGVYTHYINGMRFQTIPIPKNATIDSASISVMSNTTSSNYTGVLIYAEDTDDAATFASTTHEPYDAYVSRTTNEAFWAIYTNSWTAGSWYSSKDISQVVQEVVDRASWASNNDIAFVIVNYSSLSSNSSYYREIRTYDYAGNVSGPKFNATYTELTVRTWDGGGGANTNWSTAANWSGDTVPATGDAIIFDSTSIGNSTVDSGFTNQPASIRVNTGYTGTITQSVNLTTTGTVTVNQGTWAVGTYNLNTGSKHLNITGGTLTIGASSSTGITTTDILIGSGGTLTCSGNSILNASQDLIVGGTFTKSTSTVNLTGSGTIGRIFTDYNSINFPSTGSKTTTVFFNFRTTKLSLGDSTTTVRSNWGTIYIYGSGTGANAPFSFGGATLTSTGIVFRSSANTDVPGGTYSSNAGVSFQASANATFYLQGNITVAELSTYGNANGVTSTLDLNGYNLTSTYYANGIQVGLSSNTARYGVLKNSGASKSTVTIYASGSGAAHLQIYASDASGDNQVLANGTQTIDFNIKGNFNNNDVFQAGSSTVTLNGQTADQTIKSNGYAFNNLTINNTNSNTASDDIVLSDALDVNGTFTITDGDFQPGSYNVNTAGNVSIGASGSVTKGTGTWTFDGTTAATYTDSTAAVQNIGIVSLNKTDTVAPETNNKLTLASSMTVDTMTIDGTTGSADTLDLGSGGYTLTLANTGTTATVFTVNGTLTPGTSTVKYSATNSAGNVNVATTTYNSLQLSGAETYDLTGNLTGANALTGNLTIDSGATLDVTTNDYGITLAGNWTNSGTFTARSGTVTFNGTLTGKTIKAGASGFYTLTINGSGGEWTLNTNNLTTSTLNVTAGTLNMGNLNITANAVTINGGTLTGGAGSLNFDTGGDDTLTVSSGVFTAPATVDMSDSSSYTHSGGTVDWTTNSSSLTIGSPNQTLPADTYYNLTLSDIEITIFTLSTGTTTVNNNLVIQASISCTLSVGANTLTVSGNITINSGATLSVSSGSINVGGNWTNSGTFNAGTGTVTFNGGGGTTQIISGNTTFHNFSVTATAARTIQFAASSTQTVTGIWTVSGSSGQLITLTSTSPPTQWIINPSDASISYVDVNYSNNTGVSFCATYSQSTNDNNTNWNISSGGSCNQTPNTPSDLTQKKTNDVVISTGGWTNETSVKFTATASDPDSSDTLYLCVEKDALGTSFSNTEDACGTGVAYSGTPVTVTVTITSQADNTEYHWQARVKDEAGAYSSWVSYGGNLESERDYGIDTTAPTGGAVNDGLGADQDYNDGSLTQISANWTGFDASVSGLAKYEYAIRRQSDGYYWSVCSGSGTWQASANWCDNGTNTSFTQNNLNLQTSVLYYVSVRATDNASNVSSPVDSDGQHVLPTLSFSLSSNAVDFATLNNSNNWTDTKTIVLTTSTNAYLGYTIRSYLTQPLTSLAYPSQTITDFYGTWSDPQPWPSGTYGFGYTSSDTLVQGSNRFNNGTEYAAFSQTAPGDIAADHTDVVNGDTGEVSNEQFTITMKVATSSFQAASPYRTYAIYIITANY